MHTKTISHDRKVNGCGDCTAEKITLEKTIYNAIMELSKDSWERIQAKYFEKYEDSEVTL